MQTTFAVIARVATVVLLALITGCTTGSGRLETRPFALADFDAIEISDAIEVDVGRADEFAVSVTADDNIWERVEITQEGKTLRIGLRSDTFYSNVTVNARVSMPILAKLHVSGAGVATFSGFDAPIPSLSLEASGNSTIEGAANADTLSLHLSGNSRATLTGVAANADVSMSGSCIGSITAERTLDYELSGASHLVYFGNPQVGKSETSGASIVERH